VVAVLAGGWVGDVSHYGAASGVLTGSLLANHGQLDIRDYQRRCRSFFGPGGQWQGYIDNPTRVTLNNLNLVEQTAIEQAIANAPAALTDKQKRILVQKGLPYDSFVEAVRANIYCGGDSCGRAWIIGPAMAAIHGVGSERGIPLSWLARITGSATHLTEIETLAQIPPGL
jgi:hypothetical protein